ncbi:MAG: hypothetical protein JNK56_10825 [Myxococcales bacterium]|nr:hypothetical protein [Myxococcales bacterium]
MSDCVGSSGASDSQTAKWSPNFLDPTLNNYRQSQQGDIPPTTLPDITTDTVMCSLMGGMGGKPPSSAPIPTTTTRPRPSSASDHDRPQKAGLCDRARATTTAPVVTAVPT